jgi:hypothetical protein
MKKDFALVLILITAGCVQELEKNIGNNENNFAETNHHLAILTSLHCQHTSSQGVLG